MSSLPVLSPFPVPITDNNVFISRIIDPFQTVAWGIVCTLIGVTQNFGGLIAVRIFLGITEAGLFPGFGYYISLWYKRNELAWRISIFYASTTASGAFGGILTYGILKMNGTGGLVGWRWIFILEGIFTCCVGVFAFWGMHGLPKDATFLNEDERKQVQERLAIDREGMNTEYKVEYLKQGLYDWKSYLFAVIYLGYVLVLVLFLTRVVWRVPLRRVVADPPTLTDPVVFPCFPHFSSNAIVVYGLSLFLPTISL